MALWLLGISAEGLTGTHQGIVGAVVLIAVLRLIRRA